LSGSWARGSVVSERGLAFGALALTVVVWGGSWRATAVVGEHASPLVTSALRVATAAVVLAVVVAVLRSPLPPRQLVGWVIATGLLMVVVGNHGQTEATVRAGAAPAAVLGATTPFWTAIFGFVLLRARIALLAVAGLIVGFAGVAVVIFTQVDTGDGSEDPVLGFVFGLAAPAGFGLGLVFLKILMERWPRLDLVGMTACQFLVGAVVLVALAFGEGFAGTDWGSVAMWAGVAWIGPGASAIGFVAFYAALKRMDPTRASVWIFLVPVIAVLVELARGDVPKPLAVVGMILALAGVIATSLAPERPPTPARQ
jgi:drug/metabolite transporter (DMT)-like permease